MNTLQPTPNPAADVPKTLGDLLRSQIALIYENYSTANSLGWLVYSPSDWATVPGPKVVVKVNCQGDQKASWMRGEAAFNTTARIRVMIYTPLCNTVAAAWSALEALKYAIERITFTDKNLVQAIQQFSSVDSTVEVNAEGQSHIGACTMDLAIEAPEVFDPFEDNP